MARITVEDCLEKIPNRFQLVLAATYRARMLSQGHAPRIESRNKPAVAWAERMNTGAARVDNRFIRFGWPGCPDVLGQLKDGRLLGVEVKAQAGRLRPEQALFLERIRCAGGVAFVARDLRDVLRALGEAQGP